ncbi:MAG TPA: hypothetical protein VLL04_05030, partial [Rhizomicrobium sp.]|nr:hypothetical protein [Rhizomicrobium sp.]
RDGILYSRQGLGTFVADNGAAQTRRLKREAARAALREAVRAGREGAVTDQELLDWLKKEL